jgi:hypothetical protein
VRSVLEEGSQPHPAKTAAPKSGSSSRRLAVLVGVFIVVGVVLGAYQLFVTEPPVDTSAAERAATIQSNLQQAASEVTPDTPPEPELPPPPEGRAPISVPR